MGWIHDLLSQTGRGNEDVQIQREDKFPPHTYGAGYPIVIHREELDDLIRLLKKERDAPDGWDNLPFLDREDFQKIVDDTLGDIDEGIPSPEERREEIRAILELWREQLLGSEDAVWTSLSTDYQFQFYIKHCEVRADSEEDDFEEPTELDTAREILDRIQSAHETDGKLAIVHKRDLPLKEPRSDSPDKS